MKTTTYDEGRGEGRKKQREGEISIPGEERRNVGKLLSSSRFPARSLVGFVHRHSASVFHFVLSSSFLTPSSSDAAIPLFPSCSPMQTHVSRLVRRSSSTGTNANAHKCRLNFPARGIERTAAPAFMPAAATTSTANPPAPFCRRRGTSARTSKTDERTKEQQRRTPSRNSIP